MGNQQSMQSNEFQALLNAIRKKAGEGTAEMDLEGTMLLITSNMEQSTISDGEQILLDLKLKFVSEVIKTDKVETFMEVMEEGHLKVSAPMGRLQLTPLHIAAYHNSFSVIKHLLQLPQVHVNCPNKEKDTPLNLGIYGAQNDSSAVELIRIFLTRRDLKTYCKNQKHVFPLLITVQRKFSRASKLLLTSPQRNSVDQYETWDLVNVIKLALSTNQDDVAYLINQNLGLSRRLQMVDEIQKSSEANASELLQDLVNLLEKTVEISVSQSSMQFSTAESQGSTQTLAGENETVQQTFHMTSTSSATAANYATASTTITTTARSMDPDQMTTFDAGGSILRIGNVVKTLGVINVRRGLPPEASERDVMRVAEKMATIHEIVGNKIYVEIHGDQCIARLKGEATVLQNDGIVKIIRDNSVVRIGCFVRILGSDEEVKKLVGTIGGWVHGMGETCGKTGKIVRILPNSDILVQFAWGSRFFFKPDALLQSSSKNIETQDYQNNWISAGSLVQIKKFRSDFEAIQKKNNLPFDGKYSELPWKFAVVKGIRLKAFSSAKTIKIACNGKAYVVNVECIELINSVKDGKSNDVRIGNQVRVSSDKVQLKVAQKDRPEFGDWDEGMLDVLGKVGTLDAFCIAENSGVNAVMIKVVFPDSISFFFNPRVVTLFQATESEDDTLVEIRPGSHIGASEEAQAEKWEEIDRNSLECFETLGAGAFGVVVRAEWTQKGVKKMVAVKQIKPKVVRGIAVTTPLPEILKEAKIQFSLRHPNIVPLFGISVDKDLWIVMDLVDGTDLESVLFPQDGSECTLTFERKVKLSLDMCNAIAYIHQKRYLHSDIKPLNMMVDRKSGKLYVCDFGITKFLGDMDVMHFATQYTDHCQGTLYFIAPECLQLNKITRKFRKATFAADVWALGAVFYELFTLQRLYDNVLAFHEDKITNDDTVVKKQMLNLPPKVMPIVSKTLDFNYTIRPAAQVLSEFFHELLLNCSTELGGVANEGWDQIDRNDLKCFEVRGEGYFGLVVRGEWNKKEKKRIVAIKQVKNGSPGADYIEDAMKEAKIQFSLNHPNIVGLLGISLEQDLWIVMEYVDGTDLFTLLFPGDGSDNSLTFNKKIKLALDMSSATAYMHEKGYLHGDIKPHNMLVNERIGKLYLCEFALSRFVGPKSNSSTRSLETEYTDCIAGTLYYMSPECLQQDTETKKYRRPTFTTEIWALGAVFFELFSFSPSRFYNNQTEFLKDRVCDNDANVKKRVASLPEEIREIVSKSLDVDALARPSAQEICDFFRELL